MFIALLVTLFVMVQTAFADLRENPYSWIENSETGKVEESLNPNPVWEIKEFSQDSEEPGNIPAVRSIKPAQSIDSKSSREDRIVRKKKFPGILYVGLDTTEKLMSLTFDDGPDKICTPEILKILKQYDIKATFFMIGQNMSSNPEIVKQIAEEGHSIGCHSFNHKDLSKMSPEAAWKDQLQKCQKIAAGIIGYEPILFRPPYGAVTEKEVIFFGKKGYKIIGWSVDTYDWNPKRNSVAGITARVNKYVHEGAVILMHTIDNHTMNTVRALPLIIDDLKSAGYRFCTIPQMFNFLPTAENQILEPLTATSVKGCNGL